jgi:hypothetical protein
MKTRSLYVLGRERFFDRRDELSYRRFIPLTRPPDLRPLDLRAVVFRPPALRAPLFFRAEELFRLDELLIPDPKWPK